MTNENIKNITKEINNNTSNDIVGVSYGLKIVEGKLTNEKAIIYTVKEKKPIENIDEKDLIPREIEVDGEKIKTDVIEGIIKPHGYGMCDNSFYVSKGNIVIVVLIVDVLPDLLVTFK